MMKSPEKRKKERRAFRMVVLVSQIGICMMVPIFFCVYVGQLVSEKTGHPVLFLLILLIGVLAGFRSSWQIISRFTGVTFLGKQRDGDPPPGLPDATFDEEGLGPDERERP